MSAANRTLNRQFGLVMAGALSIVGALSFVLGGHTAIWLIGAAVLMAIAALAVPALLNPLRIAWMKLAHVIGAVNSRIILTVIFAVVVTPIALVMRILGRSSIDRRPDPARASYWRPREPHDFAAKRLERQF